jgi:hypothetical protein
MLSWVGALMPLPSGCTSVTLVSVNAIDDETNAPTLCTLSYVVQGQTYSGEFNIGSGFLSQLTAAVALRKKEQLKFTQAQTILNNKIG